MTRAIVFFPKLGVPFWGPYDKGYSILGSILGSPYFGKLPNGYRHHLAVYLTYPLPSLYKESSAMIYGTDEAPALWSRVGG